MIDLETPLKGKRTYFRNILKPSKKLGYCLGDCWDYHKGCLDSLLWREGGESIYLRMPFNVLEGELDRPNAYIQFDKPYVIKHVVNTGLDKNASALGAASGFSQFQKPLDKDGLIKDKNEWEDLGEQAVDTIMKHIHFDGKEHTN
ncbi:YugN family protein [Virgibacillus ihumii]|uniref:YugN family protein n=1 Tax=Virgibacillus ihumii TaxID=2686091 RepID=UPI00157BC6C0|nr:YugN family protein [Virgibacillus ihumii]